MVRGEKKDVMENMSYVNRRGTIWEKKGHGSRQGGWRREAREENI